MRRILVENARHKRCLKQGDGLKRVDLDGLESTAEGPSENVIAVDEALGRLAEEDPLAAELVKMRYFAGLTLTQTAEALGMSSRTADRCWAYAKAWLYQEIARGRPGLAGEPAGLERP
jgi:RNA polymerase sigma factor (TIGR02999 family)